MMRYAFIGGGNMGRALASALIANQVCTPGEIFVVDPDAGCRERLQELGCMVAEAANGSIGQAEAVVLAVKPQDSGAMFEAVRPHLSPGQLVISIMAGISIATMEQGLGEMALVRVMPNTPAQVGLGMNVYYSAPQVGAGQREQVEALLNASGEAMLVSTEDAIDAATAISGSGPAYVFYVAEHWMRKAEALGFSSEQAARLVQQTLLGATKLWQTLELPVATLRAQVTSKGGTTAAALEYFETGGVGRNLEEGMEKAYQRAKELGG